VNVIRAVPQGQSCQAASIVISDPDRNVIEGYAPFAEFLTVIGADRWLTQHQSRAAGRMDAKRPYPLLSGLARDGLGTQAPPRTGERCGRDLAPTASD
jgi:hypothetical protein